MHIKERKNASDAHMHQEDGGRYTLATPFGGYSPFNLGSTHCFTLSSPSLGVA